MDHQDHSRQIKLKMSTDTAQLYRMVTSQHLCPFGIRARWLLKRKGYRVEDHRLADPRRAGRIQGRA